MSSDNGKILKYHISFRIALTYKNVCNTACNNRKSMWFYGYETQSDYSTSSFNGEPIRLSPWKTVFLHGTLRILFASHVHHEDLHRTQDINPVISSIICHDSKPATNSLENISFHILGSTTQELGKSNNSIDSSLLLTSSYLTKIKSVLSRTSATSPNFPSKREKSQLWPEASMDE